MLPSDIRMLLVEDNPDILRALLDLLQLIQTVLNVRLIIRQATTTSEALQIAREFQPQLLMTDDELPPIPGKRALQHEGVQLVNQLRQLIPGLKTILMSGTLIDPALQAVADRFLRKPIPRAYIENAIRDLFSDNPVSE